MKDYFEDTKTVTPPPSLGEEMLMEANRIVSTDRNHVYGHPYDDFTKTAGILSSLGFRFEQKGKIGPMEAWHVPILMMAVKMSRLVNNTRCFHKDSYTDIAGYVKTAGMVEERAIGPQPVAD